MKAYNVYLNGRKIDTVFYGDAVKVTAADVKRSLIDHDGYDPRIIVNKARN